MTDLGKLIQGTPPDRDAIHVAIAPVTAAETLNPGDHIGLVGGSTKLVGTSAHPIGIVDPFLKEQVRRGTQFWMVLYPNTITSLRHDWVHPAFEPPSITQEYVMSRLWLEDFAADKGGLSYSELLEAAEKWVKNRIPTSDGGRFESCMVPDAFWYHYEQVTATKVPEDRRDSFFSCSC